MKKLITLGVAMALAVGTAGAAYATTINLPTIQNGDFSAVTFGATTPAGTEASVINRASGGQQNPAWVTVNDWQLVGVNSSAHTAQGVWYQNVNGALNGPGGPTLADVTAPPSGGSFVGLNGDQGGNGNPDIQSGIQQQLTGLTPGGRYVVSFDWAASQQSGVHGPTTTYVGVELDGQTIGTTTPFSIPNHGFSGWTSQSYGFTATSSSQWLTFLSFGTPAGLPPMALLTNVSLAVPEPPVLALFGFGLLGLGLATVVARRRAHHDDDADGDLAA